MSFYFNMLVDIHYRVLGKDTMKLLYSKAVIIK